jgi:hypothetical protein
MQKRANPTHRCRHYQSQEQHVAIGSRKGALHPPPEERALISGRCDSKRYADVP